MPLLLPPPASIRSKLGGLACSGLPSLAKRRLTATTGPQSLARCSVAAGWPASGTHWQASLIRLAGRLCHCRSGRVPGGGRGGGEGRTRSTAVTRRTVLLLQRCGIDFFTRQPSRLPLIPPHSMRCISAILLVINVAGLNNGLARIPDRGWNSVRVCGLTA